MSGLIKKAYTSYYKFRKKNLKLGDNTLIEGTIEIDTNGNIVIGNNCGIRKWSCFKPYGGSIQIGDNCTVNSFCHISGNGGVRIGNNVLIATQCVIVSANHNFENMNIDINKQGETRSTIVIEDNCWLGAGVKVLAGVVIGSGSVIGAGSVVTKNIPPNSVAVGVPARVINVRGT